MKNFTCRITTSFLFLITGLATNAQITVSNAIVPQFIQGSSGTNNNRTPFVFWAELTGLTPNATYKYYLGMDSANANATSNGAGNPYFVNLETSIFRRNSSTSMSSASGHDTLHADANGNYKGWFMIEPTSNARFTTGKKVYPKINFNDGTGGTSVATRLSFSAYPIRVVDYGTIPSDTLQCSAIIDSVSATNVPSKSFVFLYDNTLGSGRPISGAVVELDSLSLTAVTSIIDHVKKADTLTHYWATLIPNKLNDGVRRLEYRAFSNGSIIDTDTSNTAVWCSGVNTENPSSGSAPLSIYPYFDLTANLNVSNTTVNVASVVSFTATSNSSFATYSWNFGDGNTATGNTSTHQYATAGTYTVILTATSGDCDEVKQNSITVQSTTGINISESIDVAIYPNPAADYVSLKGLTEKTDIIICDLAGKVVLKETIDPTKNLSIVSLEKGLYLLHLQNKGGQTIRIKLIKD